MNKQRLLELAGIVTEEVGDYDPVDLNRAINMLATAIAQQAKSEAQRDWPTLDSEERQEFGSADALASDIAGNWLSGGDYMERIDELVADKVQKLLGGQYG